MNNMLDRLLNFVREVWYRMIGQTSVQQALNVDIVLNSEMIEALRKWSLMYTNQSPWLSNEIKSLNLPAAISSEIARLTTLELKINLSGSDRAVYLQKQIDNLLPKLRQYLEYGCAKGGLIFKPYVSNKQIVIDLVQADEFFPVEFDSNGNLTSAIFVDQHTVGNYFYTRLEFHSMQPEGYVIKNLAYRSMVKDMLGQRVDLSAIADWADLAEEAVITGVTKPLFAYFRYPLANTIDTSSPLGVSCFSRAEDLIEEADKIYSDLLWEMESSQRALFCDMLAFKKDEKTGKPILPNKRLYRVLDAGGKNDALFEDFTPTIREQNIINALNEILRKIEFNVGLAYGTLSDAQDVAKTATEIVSSRQRSYTQISDVQKTLKAALDDLIYGMDIWASGLRLAPKGKYSVSYDFDDSLVRDSESQAMSDRQTVSLGGMPLYIYLMRNYSLDEETARKWVAESQSEKTTVNDLFAGA